MEGTATSAAPTETPTMGFRAKAVLQAAMTVVTGILDKLQGSMLVFARNEEE
jgi:hypothetical protein